MFTSSYWVILASELKTILSAYQWTSSATFPNTLWDILPCTTWTVEVNNRDRFMEAKRFEKDSWSRWDLNQLQWMGNILTGKETSFYIWEPKFKSNMSSWHIVQLRLFFWLVGLWHVRQCFQHFIISLSTPPSHYMNLLFFFLMHIKWMTFQVKFLGLPFQWILEIGNSITEFVF